MTSLMGTFGEKYSQCDYICVVKSPLRICQIGSGLEAKVD